jgi:hypothetical protein
VGAGVAGSAIAASGAQSAAQTQASAAENAQQISLQEFNTITGQEQPYMQAGYGALSALDYGLGISPQTATGTAPNAPASASASTPTASLSGYWNNPSYAALSAQNLIGAPMATATQGMTASGQPTTGASTQSTGGPQGTGLGFGSLVAPFTMENFKQLSPAYNFQLQQGQQNVLNADAAGQGALSGAALKDLSSFNQNQANTSFNNAFNQYQTQQGNIFSRLSGIAQLGQSSAANTGQQGTALAGQAAQSATNVGTALAAGQVGTANAISGGINSAIPWIYQAASNSGGG